MSDKDEVRELWQEEQDKKETAALNQAGEELFTGMRKPELASISKTKLNQLLHMCTFSW